MTTKPFFTLLTGAKVLAPEDLGVQNILIAGTKIAAIGSKLEAPKSYPCEVIDLSGCTLMPGFIDSHVHVTGGGGEGGFATRTPEILLSHITTSGITTVVGCLGTDGTTRSVLNLLAKVRALTIEGITAYMYTGAYQLPTPTITGSVRNDIIIVDKVIGSGEIALSDHRSSQPSYQDYKNLAAQSRVGGMVSGKAGVVDMHIGDGKDGLALLFKMVDETEIPINQFIPTHINRNKNLLKEGIKWAKQGGIMDITSGVSPTSSAGSVKPSQALKQALDAGVDIENITMSSDGNGSVPIFDAKGNTVGVGVASQKTMLEEVHDMVKVEKIAPSTAIRLVTSNIARVLKLNQKGLVKEQMDADFTVVDKDFHLKHVWAKGQQMVKDNKAIVLGTFEGK